LSLISILATIVLLPRDDHPASEPLYQQRVPEPTPAREMLGMRYAWRLLGLLIVFFFVNSMFLSQIGLFLSARFSWGGHPFGAHELGWTFAYAGFINMIIQGLLITRANRFASDRTIIMAAFASMGFGFAGLAIGSRIDLLVVFLTLIIIGSMFTRSTLTAELSRSTAVNRQGMIMGLNQSLMSGANIGAPLLSGALIGHQLFVVWALAMAVIAAIGATLARRMLPYAQAAAVRTHAATPARLGSRPTSHSAEAVAPSLQPTDR
jgi:MFS family permease